MAVRARVGGTESLDRLRRTLAKDGPRWFAPDRPIRRVHGDPTMFVGGLRALLLQSLHPLAMAGVAQHSDYRTDPWSRLARTADFVTITTYGTADDAAAACAAVRRVHDHVTGVAPDGRAYEANDPHLLGWVHLAEVDSFLAAFRRYGAGGLTPAEADGYVRDMARIASELGVDNPPRSVAQLRSHLAEYRPELRSTREAREAARFLLTPPGVPLVGLAPYGMISAAAVGLLPLWARWSLGLPMGPVADRVVVRPAGTAVVGVLRWALTPGSVRAPSARRTSTATGS